MPITERAKLGIGCIVIREFDEMPHVLMGIRKGSHGAGELSLPGGKPDADERPGEAAIRELQEETALVATDALPLGFWTYDRFEDDNLHYVTLYFVMEVSADQDPLLMEPEKCEGWGWYSPYAPSDHAGYIDPSIPLFAGVADILNGVL